MYENTLEERISLYLIYVFDGIFCYTKEDMHVFSFDILK